MCTLINIRIDLLNLESHFINIPNFLLICSLESHNSNTLLQEPQPKQPESDIFRSGFDQPAPPTNSSNPFDAFITPSAPQPTYNSSFPSTGPPTSFGTSQPTWNSNFTSNFSSDPFSEPGAFDSQLSSDPNKNFASLNPFGGNGFSK